jgi:hypothetical protein
VSSLFQLPYCFNPHMAAMLPHMISRWRRQNFDRYYQSFKSLFYLLSHYWTGGFGVKPFVQNETLQNLYIAHVLPHFDYCSPLWDSCGSMLKAARAMPITTLSRIYSMLCCGRIWMTDKKWTNLSWFIKY